MDRQEQAFSEKKNRLTGKQVENEAGREARRQKEKGVGGDVDG